MSPQFDFADRFFSHSTGVGFNIDVPHFSYTHVKFMLRDNIRAHGVMWHFVLDWKVPLAIGGVPLVYAGYIDSVGPEGRHVDTISSDTQLLLDIGKWLKRESHLFAGIEFRYIHNQFYIGGANEYVPQPMVKWVF